MAPYRPHMTYVGEAASIGRAAIYRRPHGLRPERLFSCLKGGSSIVNNATVDAADILSIPETARTARTSSRQIYRFLNSGALKGVKLGGRTYITRAEVARFLTNLPPYRSAEAA